MRNLFKFNRETGAYFDAGKFVDGGLRIVDRSDGELKSLYGLAPFIYLGESIARLNAETRNSQSDFYKHRNHYSSLVSLAFEHVRTYRQSNGVHQLPTVLIGHLYPALFHALMHMFDIPIRVSSPTEDFGQKTDYWYSDGDREVRIDVTVDTAINKGSQYYNDNPIIPLTLPALTSSPCARFVDSILRITSATPLRNFLDSGTPSGTIPESERNRFHEIGREALAAVVELNRQTLGNLYREHGTSLAAVLDTISMRSQFRQHEAVFDC